MINIIRNIIVGVMLAAVAYCITAAGYDWYIDQLKASGGFIAAKDVVGAQIAPWGFAILLFAGYLKLTSE